jgi:hypothetical protein
VLAAAGRRRADRTRAGPSASARARRVDCTCLLRTLGRPGAVSTVDGVPVRPWTPRG